MRALLLSVVVAAACAPVGPVREPALFFVRLAPIVRAELDDVDPEMPGTQIDAWLRLTDGGALVDAKVAVDARSVGDAWRFEGSDACVRVTLPDPPADGTPAALDAVAVDEAGRRYRTSALLTVVPAGQM